MFMVILKFKWTQADCTLSAWRLLWSLVMSCFVSSARRTFPYSRLISSVSCRSPRLMSGWHVIRVQSYDTPRVLSITASMTDEWFLGSHMVDVRYVHSACLLHLIVLVRQWFYNFIKVSSSNRCYEFREKSTQLPAVYSVPLFPIQAVTISSTSQSRLQLHLHDR